MYLKRYQERVLDQFADWFDKLEESGGSPSAAWENAGFDGHVTRRDSSGRSVPHVCLKVPTGGGKTLLAAESIVRICRRTDRKTGLLLWAVPNRAIFAQTKSALWSKEHPYRMALDHASGHKVKVLEKDDPLSDEDIQNFLCVMLLSLQSANRSKNKEFLKMFQESGRYSSFFPDIDDTVGFDTLREEYPGLKTDDNGRTQRTLENVLKISRPIVILDEAHKAYGGQLSESTFNQFDPSIVLELSATPDDSKSNILVEITGLELKEEEMIKLPVHVTGHNDASWQDVLREADQQLDDLSHLAGAAQESTHRYLRPMAVVRVEVTGRQQIGGNRLHAEDVREFLISAMRVPSDEVRVQSSEAKELDGEDLLSDKCRVRWIITKDALKEGWDCSFAYVLVLLDNTRARMTVTQMMGRVLRQPYAQSTGIDELDACYVHCHNLSVDKAVEAVKNELQAEGFGDVVTQIRSQSHAMNTVRATRRDGITNELSRLPRVLHRTGGEIDYEEHILADIEWEQIRPPKQWDLTEAPNWRGTALVDVERNGVTTFDRRPKKRALGSDAFDLAWHVRQLRDCIPNPWQAARILQETVASIDAQGRGQEWLAARRSSFVRAIEQHVSNIVDALAEQIFKDKLRSGEITFDLDLPFEYTDCYELSAPEGEPPAGFQRTLFSPAYIHDMNSLEKKYAVMLDGNDAIRWWHRIAARKPGEYRLQGWRRDYVYPDFVALAVGDKIMIHETKGEHLRGNDDTEYKRRLLACLATQLNASHSTLTIHSETTTADFRILFESDLG